MNLSADLEPYKPLGSHKSRPLVAIKKNPETFSRWLRFLVLDVRVHTQDSST